MKAKKVVLILVVCAVVALGFTAAALAKPGAPGADIKYQTKVFVQGAPVHGANGLAMDQDGRLIVASAMGCELVVMNPRTGQVLDRLGHDVGVNDPDDVAVGPDGSIYWTDLSIGEVGRLEPDGTLTKQFVAAGMNPIAFTDDGRLFVAQAFMGDGLYELDPELIDPPTVVIPDSGIPPFVGQLNGFDFGRDGWLYAPQPFFMRIVKIDPDTGYIDPVPVADFSALGLHPGSVEFDSQGRLYASLADGGMVVRIDLDTHEYRVIARTPGIDLDNMVFDSRDRLFVSNSADGAVYSVGPGRGVRTLSRGGVILPGGLAVMEDSRGRESLWVADVWTLHQFDARSGRLLGQEHYSHTGGTIVQPWAVAPDGGNLLVASWMAFGVQIWNPVEDQEEAFYNDFAAPPLPINAIRFQGDVVVAELAGGSVQRRDAGTGTWSPIAAGLFVPAGLAATNDDLWVSDWATGIVWQIVTDGVPAMLPVAAGLSLPEGMTVDSDGSLLVVETGKGQLSRIDPASGHISKMADGLELGLQGAAGSPPTWALSSVVVAKDGTIFVSGDLGSVVYRIRALPASR